jgi:hypothetical protein
VTVTIAGSWWQDSGAIAGALGMGDAVWPESGFGARVFCEHLRHSVEVDLRSIISDMWNHLCAISKLLVFVTQGTQRSRRGEM